MTTEDLIARYMSDVAATKRMFENDRSQLDDEIERLDNKLFGEFGFMPTTEIPVDRINEYGIDHVIDNIKSIGG